MSLLDPCARWAYESVEPTSESAEPTSLSAASSMASRSGQVAGPGRVVDRAPAQLASTRARSRGIPSSRAAPNTPAWASPAPLVSTAWAPCGPHRHRRTKRHPNPPAGSPGPRAAATTAGSAPAHRAPRPQGAQPTSTPRGRSSTTSGAGRSWPAGSIRGTRPPSGRHRTTPGRRPASTPCARQRSAPPRCACRAT